MSSSTLSKATLFTLIFGMLFTGTINTILNKLQDMQCVSNCQDPDSSNRKYYEQPVFQTLTMFIGETCCLLVYFLGTLKNKKTTSTTTAENNEETPLLSSPTGGEGSLKEMKGWHNLWFAVPTICDMTGTSLMNIGLLYTSASIYQMLRGSVVLFTGTFSVIFLGRRHPFYRWFALCMVFLGVGIVGASSVLQSDGSSSHDETETSSWVGVFMVVLAQVFTASQFVIEEKILSRYSTVPLKAVGLEGFFGLSITLLLVPVFYFSFGINGPKGGFFDIPAGFHQTVDIPVILYSGIGVFLSIAFFNWFGLSVTRHISATSRSTIDTCRTIFIWMTSLYLGWENFKSLQVVGFVVLLYGTLVFNDVLSPPWCCPRPIQNDSEEVVESL